MADLITLDEAKEYLGFAEDDEHDDILLLFLKAGSDVFRSITGLNWDQRGYTETRSGKGTRSIRVRQRPIAATPLPTATENGTTLTVAVGFSTTADVVVELGDEDTPGAFHRRTGPTVVAPPVALVPGVWAPGVLNIVLGYTGGFAVADVPEDIKVFVKYATAFLWKHTDKKEIGVAQRSVGQGSTTFLEEMPKVYRDIAERRRAAMLAET